MAEDKSRTTQVEVRQLAKELDKEHHFVQRQALLKQLWNLQRKVAEAHASKAP